MWRSLVKNFNYLTGQQQHQSPESLSTPRDSTGMQSSHGNEDIELVSMDNRVSPITQAAVSAPKKSMISSIGDYCVGSFKSFIDVCWYDRSDTTKSTLRTAATLTAAAAEAATLYFMIDLLQKDETQAEQDSAYFAKVAAISVLTGAAARFALTGIAATLHAFNLKSPAKATYDLSASITFIERNFIADTLSIQSLIISTLYQSQWFSFATEKMIVPWGGAASGWRMARLLEEVIAELLRINNLTIKELDYFEGRKPLTPYDLKLFLIDSIKLGLAGALIYLGQTSLNTAKTNNETIISETQIWLGLVLAGTTVASLLERVDRFRNALTVERAKFAEPFMYTVLLALVRPGSSVASYLSAPLLGVFIVLNAFITQRLIGHRNHIIEQQLAELEPLIAMFPNYVENLERQLDMLRQVDLTFFGKMKQYLCDLRDFFNNTSDNLLLTWPGKSTVAAIILFLAIIPFIFHVDEYFANYLCIALYFTTYHAQLKPIQYYDFQKKHTEGTLTTLENIRFNFHYYFIENPAFLVLWYLYTQKLWRTPENLGNITLDYMGSIVHDIQWGVLRGTINEIPALPIEVLESLKTSFSFAANLSTEAENTNQTLITTSEAKFITRAYHRYIKTNPQPAGIVPNTNSRLDSIMPAKVDGKKSDNVRGGNPVASSNWAIVYSLPVLGAFEKLKFRK